VKQLHQVIIPKAIGPTNTTNKTIETKGLQQKSQFPTVNAPPYGVKLRYRLKPVVLSFGHPVLIGLWSVTELK
jgi:hypothetical protein